MKKKLKNIILNVGLVTVIAITAVHCSHPNAGKPVLNPQHEEFYKYARYLLTRGEKKVFNSLLDDDARERFIRHFWEIRDPDLGTKENEYKEEIQQRFAYVTEYLKEGTVPGWKTDRGKVFIILGPPSRAFRDYSFDGSPQVSVINWYYADMDHYIRFIDRSGMGFYHLDLRTFSIQPPDKVGGRQYYYLRENKSQTETAPPGFDLSYDSENNALLINLEAKLLSYEQAADEDHMTARIRVDIIDYKKKDDHDQAKHTTVKTLNIRKDILLEAKAKITLSIPLVLTRGEARTIYVVVTDLSGGAVLKKALVVDGKR